jgi:hypothetical protein
MITHFSLSLSSSFFSAWSSNRHEITQISELNPFSCHSLRNLVSNEHYKELLMELVVMEEQEVVVDVEEINEGQGQGKRQKQE